MNKRKAAMVGICKFKNNIKTTINQSNGSEFEIYHFLWTRIIPHNILQI
jgi:hypothetical protein